MWFRTWAKVSRTSIITTFKEFANDKKQEIVSLIKKDLESRHDTIHFQEYLCETENNSTF